MKIRMIYTGWPDAYQKRYVWDLTKRGKYWELTDHVGYLRVLEETWLLTVPRVKELAENYGMTLETKLD
jgi:hypothetical protein